MKRALYPRVRLLAASLLIACSSQWLAAASSPWTKSNRIAISADGNPDADPDDIGATPFTLAILAKAGLQENLVHYDFNNFLEYKPIEPQHNRMWVSAMGGQARWGFDSDRFHDAAYDPDAAVRSLSTVINQSTSTDPLYLIAAGPMELIYRALEAADVTARQHVIIVSHHNYNEYVTPRLWQRNWNDVQELVPNIGYLRIVDQNGYGGNGLKGTDDADFDWLRDHADPNLNWVYERIVEGKPDVSDAGILSWLININGEDERVSIDQMREWFGPAVIPTTGDARLTPEAPLARQPVVNPPQSDRIFQEVGGRIVIEAESVPRVENWALERTISGYSGRGYIHWKLPDPNGVSHKQQGTLLYKLRISNPGNYRMAFKSSNQGASAYDQSNYCWTIMGLNPISPYGTTRGTHLAMTKEAFEAENSFSWETEHHNYGTVARKEGKVTAPCMR